jgi:hypothetical protein
MELESKRQEKQEAKRLKALRAKQIAATLQLCNKRPRKKSSGSQKRGKRDGSVEEFFDFEDDFNSSQSGALMTLYAVAPMYAPTCSFNDKV